MQGQSSYACVKELEFYFNKHFQQKQKLQDLKTIKQRRLTASETKWSGRAKAVWLFRLEEIMWKDEVPFSYSSLQLPGVFRGTLRVSEESVSVDDGTLKCYCLRSVP